MTADPDVGRPCPTCSIGTVRPDPLAGEYVCVRCGAVVGPYREPAP